MEKIPYFAGSMPVPDIAIRIPAGTRAPGVCRI